MRISQEDRDELLALAGSRKMREETARVSASRMNPFQVGSEVSGDQVLEFLTRYNEFLNHPIKPLRPFIERTMKL